MSQYENLKGTIEGLKGKFAIFMHDRPDPDTMASALLLQYIINNLNGNVDTKIYYTHKPDYLVNRSLVNTLNLPFINTYNISESEELEENQKAGIVDVPTLENLTNGENLDIIIDIDHHKEIKKNKGANKFTYYESTGSCTSILLDFLEKLNLKLDKEKQKGIIITSYLGIQTDTQDFNENALSKKDAQAKEYLEKLLTEEHKEIIKKIEEIEVPASWTQKLEEIKAPLLYKGIGIIDDAGMIPYLSDEMIKTGNFKTVIIYGLVYEMGEEGYKDLYIRGSGRSMDASINLNEAFGTIFHKKTTEGKKIKGGGARKTVGSDVATAGGSLNLMEHKDVKVEDLDAVWNLYKLKIESRIETEFKISSD